MKPTIMPMHGYGDGIIMDDGEHVSEGRTVRWPRERWARWDMLMQRMPTQSSDREMGLIVDEVLDKMRIPKDGKA